MQNWVEETKKLRTLGHLEKTLEFLKKILSQYPNDPQVYYQIAWTHDVLGKETDAIPAYEKAISLGLTGEDLENAYLGLGSTYRCVGDYKNSEKVLMKAQTLFPENRALKTFYALTLFNLKDYSGATKLLLKELAETTADHKIKSYSHALLFYSDKLEKIFE